jgi:hypothetical protein
MRKCLGGVGEAVAGGDRNLKLPVRESLREFAQLVSVRADVDAGDLDAALLACEACRRDDLGAAQCA